MIDISIAWNGLVFVAKLPIVLSVHLCKKTWKAIGTCVYFVIDLISACDFLQTFKKLPRDRKRLLLDIFGRDIQQLQQLGISQRNRIARLNWVMRGNPEIIQDLIKKKLLCYKKIGDGLFSKQIIALTNRTINLLHHRYTYRCQRIASRNKIK